MGFKKYFGRSFGRVRAAGYSSSDDESDPPQKQNHRRTSRWRRSSSRLNSSQRFRPKEEEFEERNFEDIPHQKASAHSQADPSPPPLSPSASQQLPEALEYFEINRQSLTRDSVKKKYKRLSLIHHPDRNGNTETSVREMQQINHYFDLLEEELDRLDEKQQDEEDRQSNPQSQSGFEESDKTKGNRRNSSSSDQQSSGGTPSRQHSENKYNRSSNSDPESRTSTSQNENTSPRIYRPRRRTSTERRQRRQERRQERFEMEREMKREWSDTIQRLNFFRKKLSKIQRENSRTYAEENLHTTWGRDLAYDSYDRQVQFYIAQVKMLKEHAPTKPKYTLMELCNEDAVVAMRLGETRIAIEILHQEIEKATTEWILLKTRGSSPSNVGEGVYESSAGATRRQRCSTQPDKSYFKNILDCLIRPLDDDGNSILHYAVYNEDHEMISYLIQIARQHRVFARFITYSNLRTVTAGDLSKGCSHRSISLSPWMVSLTEEGLILMEEKHRRRALRRQQQERNLLNHPMADSLLNLILSLLVGKYVTCSGWVISWIIICLAHWVELGNNGRPSTSKIRMSKTFFFSLHTGWYLLVRCLSRIPDLIVATSTRIPFSWQLQLIGVVVMPFVVKLRYWPLRYVLMASVLIESAFISCLDWVLLKNGTYSSGHRKHLLDYAVLSVPFLALQLIRAYAT